MDLKSPVTLIQAEAVAGVTSLPSTSLEKLVSNIGFESEEEAILFFKL